MAGHSWPWISRPAARRSSLVVMFRLLSTPSRLTVAMLPPPTRWARATRASSTWRPSASPRSCSTASCSMATPVGPPGCPRASSPPSVLNGMRPPGPVSPSTTSFSASPSAQKPEQLVVLELLVDEGVVAVGHAHVLGPEPRRLVALQRRVPRHGRGADDRADEGVARRVGLRRQRGGQRAHERPARLAGAHQVLAGHDDAGGAVVGRAAHHGGERLGHHPGGEHLLGASRRGRNGGGRTGTPRRSSSSSPRWWRSARAWCPARACGAAPTARSRRRAGSARRSGPARRRGRRRRSCR